MDKSPIFVLIKAVHFVLVRKKTFFFTLKINTLRFGDKIQLDLREYQDILGDNQHPIISKAFKWNGKASHIAKHKLNFLKLLFETVFKNSTNINNFILPQIYKQYTNSAYLLVKFNFVRIYKES